MTARAKATAAISAVALTAVLAGSGAQAAFSECAPNRACLWGNNDYVYLLSTRAPGEGIINLGATTNDEMDSWGNRTTRNAAGYGYADGIGICQTFAAGRTDNNVASWYSDAVTSWQTNSGC